MKNSIVRLSSLRLQNFKNVKDGEIVMPNTNRKNLSCGNAEILGIYGQNGSGKTAVVDALYALQRIMIGASVPEDLDDFIHVNENTATFIADFNIFIDAVIYEVTYMLEMRRGEEIVEIMRETLSCAKNEEGNRTNKTVFMDYQREARDTIFLPKKRLDEILECDKENKTDLIVARKMAEKSNCSYIFGESSREIFCREYTNNFKNYSEVIEALINFAVRDLFVIQSSHSGAISANYVLPMAFRIEKAEGGMKGDFPLALLGSMVLTTEDKAILDEVIELINTVLYTIIPGMSLEILDYGMQLTDAGEEGHRIELVSRRDEFSLLPIRMESEGIIKIISILNALIQAFANPSICLVIDELDAGIFEYMLGELLDIFSKSAKGQLIFTSHNLRALEMLDKDSIMFSTANPMNRYIHMKNVRNTNNFRDVYLRGITLGGQDEVIYEETDSIKIARAFRKAGRNLKNGI